MCSGITHGRVLNGELYAQRFQNLIYVHLFTDCFMNISPQSSELIQLLTLEGFEKSFPYSSNCLMNSSVRLATVWEDDSVIKATG